MTRLGPGRDFDTLLVDGNNLLHRTYGGVSAGAQRALLARLRNLLPGVRKVIVFDGHRSSHAEPAERWAGGLELLYAGGNADEALMRLIGDVPWQRRGWTVLVTDDRALTERARGAGVITRRLDWLTVRLEGARR